MSGHCNNCCDCSSSGSGLRRLSSNRRVTARGAPSSNKEPQSLIDPAWEKLDPNPDLGTLFQQYNKRFFRSKLNGVEVKWSNRMTSCAGICSVEDYGISVRLSQPLLSRRPRADLVNTLLHEMIHAYLFATNNDKDREDHGPEFCKHMDRINNEARTNIDIYHDFQDAMDALKVHWWKCDGPCRRRKPFYGLVKRSMNRPPGPSDRWWQEHQSSCGGQFVKIREPEPKSKSQPKRKSSDSLQAGDPKRFKPIENLSASRRTSTAVKPSNRMKAGKENSPRRNSRSTNHKASVNSKSHRRPISFSSDSDDCVECARKSSEIVDSKQPSIEKKVSIKSTGSDDVFMASLNEEDNDDVFDINMNALETKEDPPNNDPTNRLNTRNTPLQPSIQNTPENSLTKCDLCGAEIPTSLAVRHMNLCLGLGERRGPPRPEMICPVCGMKLDSPIIASHLNACIPKKPGRIFTFSFGD